VAKRIFISYRRDDTGPAAGRIYDRLGQLIPKANVFFDVSTIRGGEDFEQKIIAEIARSDAVLVFIGQQWLKPSEAGGRPRIWDDGDYVRAELRAALGRSKLLLPVLVDDARMPAADLLPDDVKSIAARNALPLRHTSFDDDAENIVSAVLGTAGKLRPWERQRGIGRRIAYAAGGAGLGLVALAAIALAHFWVLARPLSASVGDATTTLLLLAAPIAGAWLGWRSARSGRAPTIRE